MLEGPEPTTLRSHGLRIKAVREEKREVDFVASTDAVDSYDEIVDQASWQLGRFKSNPVVLFAHNSRELPIGTCTRCEVVKQASDDDGDLDLALECTIKFATEEMNPKAEQVFKMVQAKILRAVSVGFNPHTYAYEKRDDKEVCVLRDCELFEISVVPIPANQEALAKMRAKARETARIGAGKDNKSMKTLEEALKAIEAKAAELAAVEKALTDERTVRAALDAQVLSLVAERDGLKKDLDAARAEAKKSADDLVEAKVKALVGVKILPTEIETMAELAKANPAIFEKMMAQRGPLDLLKSVIPSDPKAKNGAEDPSTGEDLAAEVERLASAAAGAPGDLAAAINAAASA